MNKRPGLFHIQDELFCQSQDYLIGVENIVETAHYCMNWLTYTVYLMYYVRIIHTDFTKQSHMDIL